LQGHEPVFIANTLDQDFQHIADSIDCLIITGGDDSNLRRSTELRLASIMMQNFKPILGVCHGAMLLSEVLGGTVSTCDGHLDCEHAISYQGHTITVNSFHNQTITRAHSTALVLCQDSNGHCEAWRDGLISGVMWHPERMSNPFLPQEIQEIMKL